MENKNEIYNMPLASFTFGKDNQKLADIYSNPLFNEIKTPSDMNNNPIQSSLSQDYFETGKYKKYNNTSGALKKIIDFNSNNNDINNYNNNFYNTNQSAKIVNSNYGGEFTFGQNNDMKSINDINQNESNNFFNSSLKNNYRNYKDINNNSLKNNINFSQFSNINTTIFHPIFFDENNNENNSYLTVILHSIFNIKPLFTYILNLHQNPNKSSYDYSILSSLKEILQKLQKSPNDKINIRKFKEDLSSQFKNRRKFILNHPDDPVDLFFIILNSIHSFAIKSPINEISDEICNYKCFSHKYIWMDLTRIDECGCNGTSRRLFSNHNYITDIPMNKIFNYIDNLQKNPKYNIIEINQKLFFYYKDILKNLVMNCPMNGTRCEINKTKHRLFLANSPSYFIFNLDYNESDIIFNNNTLLIDILKSFILISKNIDINMIFEENTRNKNDYNINKKYNLLGIVFVSLTKIYSCAFIHKGINNNTSFYYYKGNNNYVNFNSFYNLVLYSLKNGIIPLILFYEEKNNEINERTRQESIDINNNNINNSNDLLTKEQILHLEKYCNNIDNLFNNINNNKIRTNENILNTMFNKINNNNNNTLSNKPSSLNNYKPNKNNQNSKPNPNYNIENNNTNSTNNTNNNNENSLQNRNNNYKHNIYNNKSVQNHNNYINNNDMYYIQNNNSNEKLDDYNDKKYKKVKYETDVKQKVNRMIKPNIEEYSSNLWEMPTPYIPYKKEEPIALHPIQKNQNSLEINNKAKGNSENYFYKNNKYKLIKDNYNTNNNNITNNTNNNINIDNNKKIEMKQKSNSYSKKNGNNFKSLINNDINNNNINSDNVNDIKRRIINNINNINTNNEHPKTKISKNPNSFNKNHNLRNINDENVRKYNLGKNNKSNFDLSANNRPNNLPYNKSSINNNTNNISNISSSNQNIKQITDEMIPSDDIKRRFKSKRLINQVINYSNKNRKMRKNRINYDENNEIKSKSDDNMNSNIYNFNYIYNNNNFDMNILENNLDKNNIYSNYRITDDKYDKKKKLEKIKKNLNINNISNLDNNVNNNSYLTDNDKSIRTLNDNIGTKKNQIGHWLCPYCSNMNRDDLIYCKICRRNKEGKILRINTQLLRMNQKMKKPPGNKNGNKGNNVSNNNTKKNDIPKSKKMMNNSNRINNKMGIKKLKRNTLIGFSSSKNFNIENYENFISNQNQKVNDYNNMEVIKKEYSFTKPSFNDRKYKIY